MKKMLKQLFVATLVVAILFASPALGVHANYAPSNDEIQNEQLIVEMRTQVRTIRATFGWINLACAISHCWVCLRDIPAGRMANVVTWHGALVLLNIQGMGHYWVNSRDIGF